MSWFYAFAGFAALVILHELGHFTAAKAVGMRVERFSLFFPPLIARKKFGETEYAIGAIPLGGYVKISGMNPSEELPDEVGADEPGAARDERVHQRRSSPAASTNPVTLWNASAIAARAAWVAR